MARVVLCSPGSISLSRILLSHGVTAGARVSSSAPLPSPPGIAVDTAESVGIFQLVWRQRGWALPSFHGTTTLTQRPLESVPLACPVAAEKARWWRGRRKRNVLEVERAHRYGECFGYLTYIYCVFLT